MNILKQIPNWFTLSNLACGVLAIVNTFNGNLETAAYLVLLATVFDFFDGFLARLFKASGELGKQLDSLADLVSFGVAPALMLFVLAEDIQGVYRYSFILLAVFSAYRLAKFNLDNSHYSGFIGVPTPITGIMCISWVFIDSDIKSALFSNPFYFLSFCVVISLLLLSKLHLPSLKLKKGPLKNFYQHIALLLIGIVALIFYKWLAVPIFYVAYVLSSFLISFASKK